MGQPSLARPGTAPSSPGSEGYYSRAQVLKP